MPGETSEPFVNMRFRVEIEGMANSGVLEVVFPEARLAERGREKNRAAYGKLFLRRGASQSQEWLEWWDETRKAHRTHRRSITVILLDASGRDLQRWAFQNARPVAYSLSNLNALAQEVLIETLEIAVGSFELPQRNPSKARSAR